MFDLENDVSYNAYHQDDENCDGPIHTTHCHKACDVSHKCAKKW